MGLHRCCRFGRLRQRSAGCSQFFQFLVLGVFDQFPDVRHRLIPENRESGSGSKGIIPQADRAEIIVYAVNGKSAPLVCDLHPDGDIVCNLQDFLDFVGFSLRAGKQGAVSVLEQLFPQCLPACGRAGDGSFPKSRNLPGNDLAPQGFGGSFRILAIEQIQIIHSDTCHMAGVFCFEL